LQASLTSWVVRSPPAAYSASERRRGKRARRGTPSPAAGAAATRPPTASATPEGGGSTAYQTTSKTIMGKPMPEEKNQNRWSSDNAHRREFYVNPCRSVFLKSNGICLLVYYDGGGTCPMASLSPIKLQSTEVGIGTGPGALAPLCDGRGRGSGSRTISWARGEGSKHVMRYCSGKYFRLVCG